jgi:glycosyltransferase involved in cell wall biosynthesis
MNNTVVLIGNAVEELINFRGSLIKAIIADGHRVVAFAPDYTLASRQAVQALGAEPAGYPLKRTGITPLSDLRSMLALRKALTNIRPDVVLSYTIKPVIWGTLAAWLAHVPRRIAMIEGLGFVFIDDNNQPSIKRKFLRGIVFQLYRLALACAHRILMLNPDDVQYFISHGLAAKNKILNIGGIGVDLAAWAITSLPSPPITFCLAARLLREKGICEYIEAARTIKARHPDTRFLLLGRLDENPGALQAEEVKQWIAEGLIEWPGHVSMRDWLAQTSVFVLPSYREGVPRSTQEAMAMGRPVITTNVPGCRETVIDGINGYLVPPRNATALAAAMEKFILDPGLISKMGKASRQIAEEKFDVRRINAVILRILFI